MWECILIESLNALNDFILHFSDGIKMLKIKINVITDTIGNILNEYNHSFCKNKPLNSAILNILLQEYFPKKIGRFICSTTPTPSLLTNSNKYQ